MAIVTRRRVLTGLGAAVVAVGGAAWWVARPKPAPIGFAVSAQELAAARALLARYPSVDAHAHPGRSFVDGAENLSGSGLALRQAGQLRGRRPSPTCVPVA
jgi:membrane dipeptidase